MAEDVQQEEAAASRYQDGEAEYRWYRRRSPRRRNGTASRPCFGQTHSNDVLPRRPPGPNQLFDVRR